MHAFNPPTRWNIFARELEDVLAVRDLKLGHLDDRGVVFHREKVRRLQQSLKSPGHLTTLNPEEMERLTEIMGLSDLEKLRLRAALLATAVEMTLLDRIDPEIAFMASDNVFDTLFAAMREQPNLAMAVGVRGGAMIGEIDMDTDPQYVEALDLIDRAMLAVHVSRNAVSSQAQVAHARDAFNVFTRSLELLQQCQTPHHESEGWRYWYGEADDGRKMAASLMRSGGA